MLIYIQKIKESDLKIKGYFIPMTLEINAADVLKCHSQRRKIRVVKQLKIIKEHANCDCVSFNCYMFLFGRVPC